MSIGGLGRGDQAAFEALRDGLNRRERVIQFVTKNANEALPRFALFVAKRSAQITQHNQMMGQAFLAK